MGGTGDGSPDAGTPPAGDERRARLESESGVLPWSELVRHFARGVVITVVPRVDLLDAAACLIDDDEARLRAWLESGDLARASDDDARDWTAREPEFLCIVASPWVLVQERVAASPSATDEASG